ncbi:Scr1 family TA system antitoxin-like transcriptional regulator [Streptomyces sp. NPDC052727]|uniref:Scr1 family TA system antitoxin-like transcriptional regulator n=1 Tax=Streptomyces sp. NPDC052727 TaxID=3154854 RepID=UPI00342E5BA2
MGVAGAVRASAQAGHRRDGVAHHTPAHRRHRAPVGTAPDGSAVARRQLERLLHMSGRETVTLRVVPFTLCGEGANCCCSPPRINTAQTH